MIIICHQRAHFYNVWHTGLLCECVQYTVSVFLIHLPVQCDTCEVRFHIHRQMFNGWSLLVLDLFHVLSPLLPLFSPLLPLPSSSPSPPPSPPPPPLRMQAMKIVSKRRMRRQSLFTGAPLRRRPMAPQTSDSKIKGEVRSVAAGMSSPRSPLANVYREIAILKKLDHPNVVRLEEVLDDPLEDEIILGEAAGTSPALVNEEVCVCVCV